LGWHVRAHPPRALCRGARAGRTWGKSDGSDHRLANREGYAKRGAWLDPSGYDAGKKIKGRKRHILVDTLGLLLNVVVHPADVQDSRWSIPSVAPGMPTVPLYQAHLCRRWLCGREDGGVPTLRDQNIDLPQLRDDLFRQSSPARHRRA